MKNKSLRNEITKGKNEDKDKEQRRITRLGAIVAIILGLISFCSIVFKISIASINIWPKAGFIYWFFIGLIMLAASFFVIIFIKIIVFILNDLKRYNIVDIEFKKYDSISDEKYSLVIYDFKFYSILMLLVLFLIIPINAYYGEGFQQIGNIIISSIMLLIGIIGVYVKRKDMTKRVMKKIGCWVLIAFICFSFFSIFITNSTATINVEYGSNGVVKINHSSSYDFNSLTIQIYDKNYDEDKNNIMVDKKIDENDLLFAKENKYLFSEDNEDEISEATSLKDEILHWKTEVDLKDLIKENGQYIISIITVQKGKSVTLSNKLMVEDDKYIFAKDNWEKKY